MDTAGIKCIMWAFRAID